MDFRIRPLRNQEQLQRQQDPMLSTLRELTDVIKLSHQSFLVNQKQVEKTNQVLYQIKSYLQKKQQSLNRISDDFKNISNQTIRVLSEISNKIASSFLEDNPKLNEKRIVVREDYQKHSQVIDLEKQDLLSKIEEITTTPIQPRNVCITVKSNIQKNQTEERAKEIKSYIAKVSTKIFSASFNMFYKQKVDFEKIKAYCSENMLGNIVEAVSREGIAPDQVQMIDNHLSDMVLPYLKVSYPHSEEKQTSSKLSSLIAEKDIFNQNRFDVLFQSPLKKMTWHGLKTNEKNDIDCRTSKEVMKLLNYVIQLPNQTIENQSKGQEKQISLYESFQEDMNKCFGIIYNKKLADFLNSQTFDSPINLATKDMASNKQIEGLLNFFTTKLKLDQKLEFTEEIEKERAEYVDKVKSYTKIKIGRKISSNCQVYTQKQIDSGQLRIKDSSIRRIMTKWIQSLQQMFHNPAQFTILRNQLIQLNDGSENKSEGLGQKEILNFFIKRQYKYVQQIFEKIKKNMYLNFTESINNQQHKVFDTEFCNERQATIGNTFIILSQASESYIVKYLIALINSLKKVERDYFQKNYGKNQIERMPLLVNLKLGDLMRCQVSSKQKQIIAIYNFIVLLSEVNPFNFELVRVKNRFNGPNKDILINVWYKKRIMVQIQLAIKNESPFLDCSDRFSHFIYELRRDILGPVSELASVWGKFSPKAQFFQKIYKLKLKKSQFILNPSIKCTKQSHILNRMNEELSLPFWCKNCKVFQVTEQFKIQCGNCHLRICSMCKNSDEILEQFPEKKFSFEGKIRRGLVLKGIEVRSKLSKTYFFIELMGKLCIFSFQCNKDDTFSEIQKKYEENTNEQQNKINFNQFLAENWLFSYCKIQIDLSRLISEIFIGFYQNLLREIKKKKKKVLSIIFSSVPSINYDGEAFTIHRIFQMGQINKYSQNIETLNVAENNIEQISFLGDFRNLRLLNMRRNKIFHLPANLFMPFLQQINLQANNIRELKEFPTFKNLRKLQLQRNQIATFEGLPQLPLLQQLNIRGNKIRSFRGLPPLSRLKKIIVLQNQIQTLEGAPLLPLVQQMNLQYNQLKSLKGLQSFINLKKLNVENNQIMDLEGTPTHTSLQEIKMRSNRLKSLRGLPLFNNLKILFVQSNKIKSLEGIQQLPALEQLNLSENQLSSFNGLPYLKSLKIIKIDKNNITNFEGLPSLPKVEKIDCSFNLLQSFKGLPPLENIRHFLINGNKITTFQGVPSLPSLEKMNLKRNKIEAIKGLPSMENLRQLILQQNEINTLVGTPDLPLLEQMDIKRNKIKKLRGLPAFVHLKKLYLDNNQIANLEDMPLLPQAELISINNNKLLSLRGLPSLPTLKKLNLVYNQIVDLQNTPNLPSMEQLNLSSNNLQSLKGVSQLRSLKVIQVNNNKIENLEQIASLLLLEHINMGGNQLKSLKGFPPLPCLKRIYLHDNQIECLEGIPQLPQLNELNLRFNKLQTLEGIPSLKKLKKLYLEGNLLKNFYGAIEMNELQQMDAKNNKIQTLKGLPPFKKLKQLNLAENQISNLQGTPSLPKLQFLKLNKNKLQSLKGLPKLMSLKQIYLENNLITNLQGTPELACLQQMNIRSNKLQSLKGLPSLKSLRYLFIQNNKIQTLEGILYLPLVEQINMKNNKLQSLAGLPSLGNLKRLNVSENQIKSLDGAPHLPLLQYLHILDHQFAKDPKFKQYLYSIFPSLVRLNDSFI